MANDGMEYSLRITADGRVFAGQIELATRSWEQFTKSTGVAGQASEKTGKAAAQAGNEVKQSGSAANEAARGYDKAASSFGGLIAKLIAAIGIGAMIKQGLSFNSEIQDATLSMGAMIAAQNDIYNNQGKLLQGQDAFNAAVGVAEEQFKKLRVEGVNVKASFTDLEKTFRGILPTAQQIGLSVDQSRKLTVSMVQTAEALNIPVAQVASETRAILSGTIRQENQLARNLGLNTETAKKLRESGQLMDYLTEKTKIFAIASEASAKTWTGMVSRLKTVTVEFAGGITKELGEKLQGAGDTVFKKFFDLNTSNVSAKLTPVIAALNSALGAVGSVFAKGMVGLVDGAIKFGEWIDKNKDSLSGIGNVIGVIGDRLTGIVGVVAKVALGIADWAVRSGALQITLGLIAAALGTINDIIRDTVDLSSTSNDKGLTLNSTVGLLVLSYVGLRAAIIACAVAQEAYAIATAESSAVSVKSLGMIRSSFLLLTSAIVGFKFGTWLSEEFGVARAAGHAMVGGFIAMWETLKFAVMAVWTAISGSFVDAINGMKTAFGVFLIGIAEGMSHIPRMGDKAEELRAYAQNLITTGTTAKTAGEKLFELAKAHMARVMALKEDFSWQILNELQLVKSTTATDAQTEALKKSGEEGAAAGARIKAKFDAMAEAARQAAAEWQKYVDATAKKANDSYVDDTGWSVAQKRELDALIQAFVTTKMSLEAFEQAYQKLLQTTEQYKQEQAELNSILADTKSLDANLRKLEEHNSALGLSKVQIEEERLAFAEYRLALAQATGASAEFVKQLQARIEIQKKIVAATMVGVIVDETKALQDQIKKFEEHNKMVGLSKTQIEKMKLAEAELQLATAKATNANKEYIAALEKKVDVQKQVLKETIVGEIKDETKALQDSLDKLKEHNDTVGLSKTQVEKLKLAKMELRLETMRGTEATQEEIKAMEELIAKQKEYASETARGEEIDKAQEEIKKAKENAKKAAETIQQSLTDALMRGFESGKGFAQNFLDTLKNMFKTLLLRPIIEGMVKGAMSMVGGLLGQLGGSGGNNNGNILNSVMGLFNGNGGNSLSTLISLGQKGYGYLAGLFGSSGTVLSTSGVIGYTAPSALAYTPTIGYAGIGNLGTIGSVGSGVSATAPLGEIAASVPATTAPAAAATPAAGSGGLSAGMSGLLTNPYTWIVAAVVSAMFADSNMYAKGWRMNDQSSNVANTPAKLAAGMFTMGDWGGGLAMMPFVGATWGDKILQRLGVGGQAASIITGSSLFSRFFGMKTPQARAGGVEGDLSLSGFNGRQFQDIEQSGGFLRSGRHWTEWQDIDPELQKMIDATIGKVPKQIKKLLGEFKIDFNDVFGEDWSQQFHIILTTDGKWENLAEMFDKETTRVYREMATTAVEAIREGWGAYVDDLKDLEPDDFRAAFTKIVQSLAILDNIKDVQKKTFDAYDLVEEDFEKFAETGEKIYETISRLATTFTLTNKISDFTGLKFSGVGLDSAPDRQALVDDAGGADALAELFSSFFNAFATPSEQLAAAFEPVRDVFDQIGIDSIPRTTQAFKDLIAAQDMSTDAGREAALQLMSAADMWKQSAGAFEQMKQNLSDSIADMRRSFELDGLDNETKYNKIKAEADAAYAKLQTETDPYEIQKLLDLIKSDMSATWGLLSDDQKNSKRAEYLAKLDELESMGLSRIDASADQYLGVQDAADAITDAGDLLASAILGVADQLGADISGVTARDKPLAEIPSANKPAEELLPSREKPMTLDDFMGVLTTLPLDLGDDYTREIASAIDAAMQKLPNELKPMLLDNGEPGSDAAFIAARDLLERVQKEQADSGDHFSGSVSDAGDGFVSSTERSAKILVDALERGAASQIRAAQMIDAATSRPITVQVSENSTIIQRAPVELT